MFFCDFALRDDSAQQNTCKYLSYSFRLRNPEPDDYSAISENNNIVH